jgi:ABC-type Mn2+/Zn2+ transport system permease subunit
MGVMSPLSKFILIAMLWGTRFSAAAIAAVLVIELLRKWLTGSLVPVTRQDYSFLGVLVLLLAAALWFARALLRELRK